MSSLSSFCSSCSSKVQDGSDLCLRRLQNHHGTPNWLHEVQVVYIMWSCPIHADMNGGWGQLLPSCYSAEKDINIALRYLEVEWGLKRVFQAILGFYASIFHCSSRTDWLTVVHVWCLPLEVFQVHEILFETCMVLLDLFGINQRWLDNYWWWSLSSNASLPWPNHVEKLTDPDRRNWTVALEISILFLSALCATEILSAPTLHTRTAYARFAALSITRPRGMKWGRGHEQSTQGLTGQKVGI